MKIKLITFVCGLQRVKRLIKDKLQVVLLDFAPWDFIADLRGSSPIITSHLQGTIFRQLITNIAFLIRSEVNLSRDNYTFSSCNSTDMNINSTLKRFSTLYANFQQKTLIFNKKCMYSTQNDKFKRIIGWLYFNKTF